jgi:hypothetical protein
MYVEDYVLPLQGLTQLIDYEVLVNIEINL